MVLNSESVKIRYRRYDHTGVYAESRRAAGDWEPLGNDTRTIIIEPARSSRPRSPLGRRQGER